MHELTTAEAAELLCVSQRQVQRLIRVGELPARRTAGDAWLLEALPANALVRSRPPRGRPWTSDVAWGALSILSGLDTPWLDGRQRSRLSSRLGAMDPQALVHACRRRGEVRRCRVSDSLLDDLRALLALSGTSAAEQFGLAAETPGVEGYCDASAWEAIRSRFKLVDDVRGNATIRIATLRDVPRRALAGTAKAVVAVDLAESYEARERGVGLRALGEMLRRASASIGEG